MEALQEDVKRLKAEMQTVESEAQIKAKALSDALDDLEKARFELQDTLSENRLLRAQKEASDDDSLLHMGALETTGKELSALKSELLSAYKQIEMYKADLLTSSKRAEAADISACELRQSAADQVGTSVHAHMRARVLARIVVFTYNLKSQRGAISPLLFHFFLWAFPFLAIAGARPHRSSQSVSRPARSKQNPQG